MDLIKGKQARTFRSLAALATLILAFRQKGLSFRHFKYAVVGAVVWWLYNNRAKKLVEGAAPKGVPRALPWLGHLYIYPKIMTKAQETMLALSKATGFETFCLVFPQNMNILVLQDEHDRKYFFKTNFENFQKLHDDRVGFDKAFHEVMGKGIFAVDGDEWRTHRKVASNLFTGRMLGVTMAKTFAEHAMKLRDVMLKFAEEQKSFDIQLLLQSLIFDTFCKIAFGFSPQSFELAIKGEKQEFQVAFDHAQIVSSKRFLAPPLLRDFLKLTGIGPERGMSSSIKTLNIYIKNIISERKEDMKVNPEKYEKVVDILGLYMQHAKRKNRPELLEDEYLRDLIMNFMIAGRDTTSYVLTNILSLVAENPEIEAELVKTAREKLKNGVEHFVLEEVKDFPLADAIFNEALRMYPSVGFDLRIPRKDDVLPSGVKVPAGTIVGISNYSIGRNPKYFDNPDEFRPHRWLKVENGVTVCEKLDEYKYPFFWAGYRICLGKDMARLEAKIFMSIIYDSIKLSMAKPRIEAFSVAPVMFYRDGIHLNAEVRA